MDGLLKTLNTMSIEDLKLVISKAEKLIQKKEQEAIYRTELEKKHQKQEQTYSMIACPQCHKLLPSDSRFCFYCGSNIQKIKEQGSGNMTCSNCHSTVPSGSRFCQNCGKPVRSAK